MKKVTVYVVESVLAHSLSGVPCEGEPAMVCAAGMYCGWQELAELCQKRGHFLFFQSGYVCTDGRVDFEFGPFCNAYEEFIKRFLAQGGVM